MSCNEFLKSVTAPETTRNKNKLNKPLAGPSDYEFRYISNSDIQA